MAVNNFNKQNKQKKERIIRGKEIIQSIISPVKDIELYKAISQFTGELRKRGKKYHIITRGFKDEATAACVIWQMVYSILVCLPYPLELLKVWKMGINHENYSDYNNMVELAYDIYTYIYSNRSSQLRKILATDVIHCDNDGTHPCIIPLDRVTINGLLSGNYYGCIYKNYGINSDEDSFRILHYFVIHKDSNKWYISSAYGSEFVSIPVRAKECRKEDLIQFIENIQYPQKNRKELGDFLKKYFLQSSGFAVRNESSDSKYPQKMPIHEGIDKEVNLYLESNDNALQVGIIHGMEEYIQYITDDYISHRTMTNVQEGGKQFRRNPPISNLLKPLKKMTRRAKTLTRCARKGKRSINKKGRATIRRRYCLRGKR